MPYFKTFGMINLQFEVIICHKIHNKGTVSQWLIQVTIFLSGTDVNLINIWVEKSCDLYLENMGMTADQTAAIMGAHTLGNMAKENSGYR